MKAITEAKYHELAATRAFVWLESTLPSDTNTPTERRCPVGHTWHARYTDLKQGRGCPCCACKTRHTNSIPKTEADYQALATKRGFEWLGPALPPISRRGRLGVVRSATCGTLLTPTFNKAPAARTVLATRARPKQTITRSLLNAASSRWNILPTFGCADKVTKLNCQGRKANRVAHRGVCTSHQYFSLFGSGRQGR